MTKLEKICVYCGSQPGINGTYLAAATYLGKSCAEQNIEVVYGGSNAGIMGEVAQSTLDAGGRVTGILPKFWDSAPEKHLALSELIITETMHERKTLMYEMSDGFVALPGGIGTLEELVEMMTWSQLGHHSKPIIIANIDGFWQPFLSLIDHMRSEGFIHSEQMLMYDIANSAEEIIPKLEKLMAAS